MFSNIYLAKIGVNVIVLIRLAIIARKVFQKVATPTSTQECDRDIRPIPHSTEIVPIERKIFSGASDRGVREKNPLAHLLIRGENSKLRRDREIPIHPRLPWVSGSLWLSRPTLQVPISWKRWRAYSFITCRTKFAPCLRSCWNSKPEYPLFQAHFCSYFTIKIKIRRAVIARERGRAFGNIAKRRTIPLNKDARSGFLLLGYEKNQGIDKPVIVGQRGRMTRRGIENLVCCFYENEASRHAPKRWFSNQAIGGQFL